MRPIIWEDRLHGFVIPMEIIFLHLGFTEIAVVQPLSPPMPELILFGITQQVQAQL